MENLEFKIQLKGDKGTPLAFIIAYNKAFKAHRFIWSTGSKVKARGFDPARPGNVLKGLLRVAETAHKSLLTDGRAVNNESLKARIELIRDRLTWVDGELHVWDGSTVQYFPIPESVDRATLQAAIHKELTKQRPDFEKVIAATLTDGQNGLFGFWSGILDGKIKPRAGKPLRASSKSVKRQTFRLVKEYDPAASFEKFDMSWYNSFVKWMEDQTVTVELPDETTETRKRFDTNTMGKHIRQLKAVLHLAYRNEIMKNDRFKYWPVTKEKNEVVTLSKEELLKINGKEYSGTKQDVKDIFVMAAFLGPRISDFKTLEKQSLSTQAGVTFFEYVQEKTGARCRIPVHPIVQEILSRRGGFPRMISEQNFRLYLKQICQDAELNDRVIVKIRDGKPQYKVKWEAISPHSARRTFASALFYGWFGKPMPASLCMRYTGHKTEKSFMLYIGASEKDLDAKALEYFDVQPVMKAS